MLGYLRSLDRHASRLLIGPDEDTISHVSEARTTGVPMVGLYARVAGHRTLFYRWNGELRLRYGTNAPVVLTNAHAEWRHTDKEAIFSLTQEGRLIVNATYALSPDIRRIDVDPTAFVEPEDFDLFLLVTNVLHDKARADRIFRA